MVVADFDIKVYRRGNIVYIDCLDGSKLQIEGSAFDGTSGARIVRLQYDSTQWSFAGFNSDSKIKDKLFDISRIFKEDGTPYTNAEFLDFKEINTFGGLSATGGAIDVSTLATQATLKVISNNLQAILALLQSQNALLYSANIPLSGINSVIPFASYNMTNPINIVLYDSNGVFDANLPAWSVVSGDIVLQNNVTLNGYTAIVIGHN